MVARKDRELFGADYAANAVFEIGNSKMSIGITNTLEHYFRTIKGKVVMDQFIVLSCQGTFAYVLPTFSSRWEIAPWAFDPVHFNDPTARFPTAETCKMEMKG